MTSQITCHCDGKAVKYENLDLQMKLADLRKKLSAENHLPPDGKEASYNFIFGTVDPKDMEAIIADPTKYIDFTIVARKFESSLTVESALCGGNAIVMFNTLARTNKSLIGLKTHWWKDRKIHVSCVRNGSGAYQPLMLEHVVAMGGSSKSPSQTTVTGLGNVCICAPDTDITFVIHGKGGVGFRFDIRINTEGKAISLASGLFCVYSKEAGEGCVGLSRWGDTDNAIRIATTRSLNIDGKNAAYYQQVTVKCTKVKSYSTGTGRVSCAPAAPGAKNGDTQVAPIDGKRYEPSTPTKGDPTGQTYGTIYNVEMDESEVFGEITIWFFNFRTLEDAKAVFEYVDPIEFVYD